MSLGIPPPDSPSFGAKIREFALIALGLTANKLDAFVRLRDLQDAGIIMVRPSHLGGTAAGSGSSAAPARPIIDPAIDLTPPPPPGGFQATAGKTQILFQTAAPVYRHGHGHARTKVYAASWDGVSALPTFADAVLYTDFPGNIGVAPFDPASTLRLWATWTSADGAESEPAGGTNGVAAATGLLEDQHIANMAVGKLLAGSLDVGQYIQSADYVAGTTGWRIATLAGGEAYLEINGNAVIGGAVIGADYIRSGNHVAGVQGWQFSADGTGQIGGLDVTTNAVRSANYVGGASGFRLQYDGTAYINELNARGAVNGGAFTGYAWPASGGTGYHISASGLLIGNYNDGRYFQVTAAGDVYAPGFSIVGGAATFAGALNGASGTFSGSLTAQVVNTEHIVGAAVTNTYVDSSDTAATVVTDSIPAGSSALVIIVYPGMSLDTGGSGDSAWSAEVPDAADLVINGDKVNGDWSWLAGNVGQEIRATFIYSIANPSGVYTITANRYQAGVGGSLADLQLVVQVAKR